MNRRGFIAGVSILFAAPLAAGAQQLGRVFRVGVLTDPTFLPYVNATLMSMPELGYVEGQNIVFERRTIEGLGRLVESAQDLVARKVDLLLVGGNRAAIAAKRTTTTIPIVMDLVLTPVESGLIESLAKPGGNATGVTLQSPETAGKILEVLRDAVPTIKKVAILWEPDFPGMAPYAPYVDAAGKALGVRLSWFSGRDLSEIEQALSRLKTQRPDAMYVVTTGAIWNNIAPIIAFVERMKVPAIYTTPVAVKQGGLMSYTADYAQLAQRCAVIIDRILKGARPSELPVEQATKYDLTINLKAAKAIGLTIPPSLLLRADQVIE